MITRIIVSFVLIPVILFLSYIGGLPFFITLLVIQLFAVYEVNNIINNRQLLICRYFLPLSLLVSLWYYYFYSTDIPFLIFLFSFILIFSVIIKQDIQSGLDKIFYNFFFYMYLFFPIICWYQLRYIFADHLTSFLLLLFVYINTWVPDSGAYFTGVAFGKHKIAPVVSPKKSIEGLFGGFIFTLLFNFIYIYFTNKYFNFRLDYIIIFLYTILIVFIGFIGDLFESLIKRSIGIKDSSNLIPGHGGILDRLDSLYFNVIFSYFFFKFLINY